MIDLPTQTYTINGNVKEIKISTTIKWGSKYYIILDETGHVYDYKKKFKQAENVKMKLEKALNALKDKNGIN